jgi:hypothetical protein
MATRTQLQEPMFTSSHSHGCFVVHSVTYLASPQVNSQHWLGDDPIGRNKCPPQRSPDRIDRPAAQRLKGTKEISNGDNVDIVDTYSQQSSLPNRASIA